MIEPEGGIGGNPFAARNSQRAVAGELRIEAGVLRPLLK
jgi:hypothetical protein